MIAEPRVFVISIKGIVELSENRENLSFLNTKLCNICLF